jgi:phenylalanine-4-hydroxylase
MQHLPEHLKKYIVEQDYQSYTAQDHAVWRYILRQLKSYLGRHAHQSYLEGLEKTGITIDSIPRIQDISSHLEKFGWRALPVSGFIPPAAFMELQSHSILPIASDMRSIDHLLYTPAPDIVHEAAGHAPIIADPEYAAYLKQYAQIAKKALISKEDLELYKAIRELSDIKESPSSTAAEIEAAELKLTQTSNAMTFVSEASELSRMNWWTAEYGLIGDLQTPRIFGAGLLSSVGESQWCLSDQVKKISLTVECIKQSYDITEPQPQLFVARDFHHLSQILEEFSETMAYRHGGVDGLIKALRAETVNTIQFDNNLQISGILKSFKMNAQKQLAYIQLNGPSQISYADFQIVGHGKDYHQQGYGTPVGIPRNFNSENLKIGEPCELQYESGVTVKGILTKMITLASDAHLLTLEEATCMFQREILFKPEWGAFDVVIAKNVTSVFGGPADRMTYGEVEDFVASRVNKPHYTEHQLRKFSLYQKLSDMRDLKSLSRDSISQIFVELKEKTPEEWLLFLELYELADSINASNEAQLIQNELNLLAKQNPAIASQILEGIKLADAES